MLPNLIKVFDKSEFGHEQNNMYQSGIMTTVSSV